MFDKAEAEYRELSEKKRIVENDKDKIRKVSRRSAMRLWLRCHLVKPCAAVTEVYCGDSEEHIAWYAPKFESCKLA